MAHHRVPPDPVAAASGTSSSSDVDTLPLGSVGWDEQTSNSAGTTTTEVVCSVTCTSLPANRRYLVKGGTTLRSNNPGGASLRLHLDSTQINRKNTDVLNSGTDLFVVCERELNIAAAGSHTFELISGVSGTDGNTVTAIANGATGTHGITYLYVSDVGPSYT